MIRRSTLLGKELCKFPVLLQNKYIKYKSFVILNCNKINRNDQTHIQHNSDGGLVQINKGTKEGIKSCDGKSVKYSGED